MAEKSWNLQKIWNDSLDVEAPREYVERDYVWASELGGSYYDRFWKMQGRIPTTPPNLRSRRKFMGGNLCEWVVLQVLARAGVLQSSQEYITYEDGPIRVTGRADFVAGGQINKLSEGDLEALPEAFGVVADSIVEQLQEKYPEGLREVNIEVKSCSGMIFEKYERSPSPQHGLQAFHYAYNTSRPTLLTYISRDDFRIHTWLILPHDQKWEKAYNEDLEGMIKVLAYAKNEDVTTPGQMNPYKEPLLSWDGNKFSKNWKVEYSNWLDDYGFKYPEEYAKPAQSKALRLNNVVKKIRLGKPIDGKVNVKTLEECYEFYPEAENIINDELKVGK